MLPLEKIAETGIFFEDNNKSLHSTMVSFNEQLTAQEFAAEINSGRLSVREAYDNFWSYEEDKELWGVEGKSLLPDCKKVLIGTATMLESEKCHELISIVAESYFNTKKDGQENGQIRIYSPFISDLVLASKLITNDPRKEIIKNDFVTDEISRLASECWIGDDLFDVSVDVSDSPLIKYMVWHAVGQNDMRLLDKIEKIGQNAIPALINYMTDKSTCRRSHPMSVLANIGGEKVFQFLMDYAKNRNNTKREYAAEHLGKFNDKKAVPLLIELYLDNFYYERHRLIDALAEIECPESLVFIKEQLNENLRRQEIPNLLKGRKYFLDLEKTVLLDALKKFEPEETILFAEDVQKKENLLVEKEEIARSSGRRPQRLVPDLINYLKKNSEWRHFYSNDDVCTALYELANIGGNSSVDYLNDYIVDESNGFPHRVHAVKLLEKIG
ncbi:MAG: HEAT repeat domain-containing protein, partial [Nanoarchaeota archaeon]|nr:HEAT repeat domain-containing protein [Nanoarchaeota archaeon]